MFIRGLLAVAIATALSGCVSPLVHPDRPMWQPKAGDARDWETMARDTVAHIPFAAPSQAVYVQSDGSPFGETYKVYLEEKLLDRGFPVVRTPDAAGIVVEYKVQSMRYAPGGKKPLTGYNSLWAAAVGGLGQFRNISSIDTGLGANLVTGVAADSAAAFSGVTDAEVVVTSRIVVPGNPNFHFIRSQTFYVRPVDLAFYRSQEPGWPVVPLRVSGR